MLTVVSYLVDGIIRASRTKIGVEKDPYGARFGKNLATTLVALTDCPAEHLVRTCSPLILLLLAPGLALSHRTPDVAPAKDQEVDWAVERWRNDPAGGLGKGGARRCRPYK